MNDSINCSGFVDMLADAYEEYDYYGHGLSDSDAETAKCATQLYTAGLNDSDYGFSND